mmetsp:Transcript_6140/g.8937  ORF Transcript_6140/g.8937 Transcript_6140/m.8937 type:complete len:137 (-) Transcript_6140:458-868(-)
MSRNYVQLRQFLEQNFPELEGNVHGSNYPPPEFAVYLSQLIGMLQIFAMAAVFMGDAIWQFVPFMNGQPPEWWSQVKENPMLVVCTLFMGNSIANSMTTTGAFEVLLDGVVVFSKLETGRMPSGPEILRAFKGAGL